MTEDWTRQMTEAIVRCVIRDGSPVDPSPLPHHRYGGWLDPDWARTRTHLADCGWMEGRYEDSEWTSFAGTFAEPQFQVHQGLDVIITCNCGELRDYRFRWKGSYAELLREITK